MPETSQHQNQRKYRPNPKRSGRSLQRSRALDVLYEADSKGLTGEGILHLLEERRSVSTSATPIKEYGVQIVRTFVEWEDDVNSIIEAASPSWSLCRMTIIERSVLRMGAVELMYLGVEVPIVVKETSSLVREFSDEKAIRFTTGVLNRINDIYKLERSGLQQTESDSTSGDYENDDTTGQNSNDSSAQYGSVYVVAGASGVGKGTVLHELREQFPNLWYSVSVTTRDPRPGEIEGKDYFFIDDARFDELIDHGELLEWALVHGVHRYGTPRGPVIETARRGETVILELDLEGARQVRKTLPEAIHIFIAPPSFDELKSRLIGRGTESVEEQERRLETARRELAAQDEFDYVIVNTTVAQATEELVNIMGLNE